MTNFYPPVKKAADFQTGYYPALILHPLPARKFYLSMKGIALMIMLALSTLFFQKSSGQVSQTFNSSGTFTVPAGVTSVTVQAWGGGGGGGIDPTNGNGTGGGGGGAYASSEVAVSPGTVTVTIGAAGTYGVAGGQTRFGALVIAAGGSSRNNSNTGGLGGQASGSTGTIKYSGGNGGNGGTANGNGGGGGGSSATAAGNGVNGQNFSGSMGGAGGSGIDGDGGNGGNNGSTGTAGTTPGGGGGGKGDGIGNSPSGSAGKVIVTYYPPTITSLGSTSGCVNSSLIINGTNLTGATAISVKIGGTSVSSITSNTGTQIVAVIGNGTSGTVSVTNSGGTATSTASFTVVPLPVLFNVSGTGSYCSGGPGLAVGLSGSATGVSYQLFNGAATVGSAVSGTGSAISFGLKTAGTYTVIATNVATGCKNTMTGTATVSATPVPNTTFTYASYTYCAAGTSPGATLSGSPATGTFSATPAGLNFSNSNTGAINLATSTPGSYAITYTVAASGGCSAYTYTQPAQVVIIGLPAAFALTGGGAYCTGGSGRVVGIAGSSTGVNYQLYRGAAIVGAAVAGTGTAISFGLKTAAGTYTVIATNTTTGCTRTMTGNAVITVTPVPNATFTYPAYTYCATGMSSIATIAGSPTTGIFSASPSGINFSSTSTGAINLATCNAGTYQIKYTVAAAGGCPAYSYTQAANVVINALPALFTVTGGGAYCTPGPGMEVGLSNSGTGVNYQLYRGATAVGTPVAGTGAAIGFGNQSTAGTYTVLGTNVIAPFCSATMTGFAVVTVNSVPAAIKISPASTSICEQTIQTLIASGSTPVSNNYSLNFSSGKIDLPIPDNNASGVANTLKITGIPTGATITGVSITFNIDHKNDGDLRVNLKGPNGNVLNLVNQLGGSGDKFDKTVIASSGSNITSATAPFKSGPYLPHAQLGIDGAQTVSLNTSNTTLFSSLYGNTASLANGFWKFSVRDAANGTAGTFSDWSITINYTTISNVVNVTWSPVTDLFTDAGATIPYAAGTSLSTVYAKPSTSDDHTYTATSTNAAGCSVSTQSALTIKPSPVINMSVNYCSPVSAGKIRITANSDIPVANTWIWSNSIAGTNTTTASYIDVDIVGDYYVAANASTGCQTIQNIGIAQELVTNGDFEAGNTGFTTPASGLNQYKYRADITNKNDELYIEGLYAIGANAQNYHSQFWGFDHTSGAGNFMIINGYPGAPQPIVWQQTVSVTPNTTYYFSAWGMTLNDVGNIARLQFNVNGVQVGTIDTLTEGVRDNSNNGWTRFYGTWTSGAGVTTAVISITDLQIALSGNDFGLDDVSFGSIAPFINLTSGVGTDQQSSLCLSSPVVDISYEVGSDGNQPQVANLPPGLTTTWDGRNLRITGTSTVAGTYNYTILPSSCYTKTVSGKIVIDASVSGTLPSMSSICYNQGTTLYLNGTIGNVTKWISSNDGGITWNDSAKTTTSLNISSVTRSVMYRSIVKNKSCKADTSLISKVGIRNLWTGDVNNDWNNKMNWSDESFPTATICDDVLIPAVSPKPYPVLSSGSSSIKNLVIYPNAFVTVTGGILKIAGSITNNGTLDVSNGTLDFNGTSAQCLAASMFYENTIKNLTITNAGGVTLANTPGGLLRVTGELSFGNINNATLHTGDNIVLASTATGTARVNDITNEGYNSGNKFDGKVTVERYFPKSRSWRMLTSPLSHTGNIFNSWQAGAPADNDPGKGMFVTGPNPNESNGLDYSTQNNYSMKSWNAATGSYINIGNTITQNLSTDSASAANIGYFTFVRGDRSRTPDNTILGNKSNTTLSSIGYLQTGTQDFKAAGVKDGITLIGNPYASPVEFNKLTRNNIINRFTVWDPNLNVVGGFVVVEDPFNTGVYTYTPQSPGKQDSIIQSSQAFFVQTADWGAASLVFNEPDKSAKNNLTMFRPASTLSKNRSLYIDLYLSNGNDASILADGTFAEFNELAGAGVDSYDAMKFGNINEMLSIKRNNVLLAVERRPVLKNNDTIFLQLTKTTQRNYRFEFKPTNLDPLLTAFLEDSFTGESTPLSMITASGYEFTISADAKSSLANRFRIVFKQSAPLPVTFTSIKAYAKAKNIEVEWKVENEINISRYEVEKSSDGLSFEKVNITAATGAGQTAKSYSWLDTKPLTGNNFYRVRSVNADGSFKYSLVVMVKMEKATTGIRIYPNPVKDGIIGAEFKNMAAGEYNVRLINGIGQTIFSKTISHTVGNAMEHIQHGNSLVRGIYQLEVTSPGKEITTIKVIAQ